MKTSPNISFLATTLSGDTQSLCITFGTLVNWKEKRKYLQQMPLFPNELLQVGEVLTITMSSSKLVRTIAVITSNDNSA
jgi:hypothetical protein